jgi:hypothetical protein
VDKTYGVLMVKDITAGTREAKATAAVKDFMSVDFIEMLARKEQRGVDKLCVEVEGKRDAEWEKLANLPCYIVIV